MQTEKQKMLSGALYNPFDPELVEAHHRARLLSHRLNDAACDSAEVRAAVIKELIPNSGIEVWIEPPFHCDYGTHIRLGDKVFFNFNCVVLDVTFVDIGSRVLFGPAVQIYTALHPLQAAGRRTGLEFGKAVAIGDDVWVGGGAIICPGVQIGKGSVIGAGSVVTKDVPAGVFAAGNPCRMLRTIDLA